MVMNELVNETKFYYCLHFKKTVKKNQSLGIENMLSPKSMLTESLAIMHATVSIRKYTPLYINGSSI